MEPLTGDLITLRELRPSDLDDYLAIVGDDRVTSWLSFDTRDRDQAEKSLAEIVERSARDDRREGRPPRLRDPCRPLGSRLRHRRVPDPAAVRVHQSLQASGDCSDR